MYANHAAGSPAEASHLCPHDLGPCAARNVPPREIDNVFGHLGAGVGQVGGFPLALGPAPYRAALARHPPYQCPKHRVCRHIRRRAAGKGAALPRKHAMGVMAGDGRRLRRLLVKLGWYFEHRAFEATVEGGARLSGGGGVNGRASPAEAATSTDSMRRH